MSSSVAETKSIPKPVLRGLHNATIKRNLIVALGLVVTITTAYKFAVNDVKKQKYAEFYKYRDWILLGCEKGCNELFVLQELRCPEVVRENEEGWRSVCRPGLGGDLIGYFSCIV